MKATHAIAEDKWKKYFIDIFKDPITDNGTKKSARGYVLVNRGQDGVVRQWDQVSREDHEKGILELVFENGKLYRDQTYIEIRQQADAFLAWKMHYEKLTAA